MDDTTDSKAKIWIDRNLISIRLQGELMAKYYKFPRISSVRKRVDSLDF